MHFYFTMKDFNNSGFCNTGTMNIGDLNTGDFNNGVANCGSRNEGDYNTGDFNFGDSNTGDFNLINNSTGVFCTKQEGILFFDMPTNITMEEWHSSEAFKILSRVRTAMWIEAEFMTNEEKIEYPEYEKNGGYLKSIPLTVGMKTLWDTLSKDEKQIIRDIPHFDETKFKKVTGLTDIS